MSKDEEIQRLEEELKTTRYNKATESHIGRVKAKLARLKEESKKSKGGKGHGFFVKKAGDASVAVIGPPSVGKSTLLNRLTNANSRVGDYDFTTTDIVPGIMSHEGFQLQVLDLPGIIYGASKGKGRGREIIAMARVVDLLVILVDAASADEIPYIEHELYQSGIRINKKRPDVTIKKKDRGGINIEFAKKSHLTHETAQGIIMEYMSNADVVIRDDVTDEELIDVILDNRVYLPACVVLNKIDRADADVKTDMEVVRISAKRGTGLETLKRTMVEQLELIRVYLRPAGKTVEKKPMVVHRGATVQEVCARLHRKFVEKFRFAVLNGPSASFPNQRVGLTHRVMDGDVLMIVTR